MRHNNNNNNNNDNKRLEKTIRIKDVTLGKSESRRHSCREASSITLSHTDLRDLHTHRDTNANLCDSESKESIQWQGVTAVASICRTTPASPPEGVNAEAAKKYLQVTKVTIRYASNMSV